MLLKRKRLKVVEMFNQNDFDKFNNFESMRSFEHFLFISFQQSSRLIFLTFQHEFNETSYFDNVLLYSKLETNENLQELPKPVDRSK